MGHKNLFAALAVRTRRTVLGKLLSAALLAAALLALPAAARAQTATIFGSLSNFDVVNDTGHDAHGFEIQFEGLQPGDIYYTFSMQRYGAPQVVPYATGVYLRWTSAYDPGAQQFLHTTVQHASGAPFAGSCYSWGANYDAAGCEHFGATLNATPTRTTYRWLIEDPVSPGTGSLVPFDPPVAIPAPTYAIIPPAQPAAEPVLQAEIVAPEPPERPEQFGDAQWVKVFKTELQREVTLDELVSDNPVVPQDASEVETAWELVQASPPSNGKQNRNGQKQNQGGLAAGTRSVVRRYESYKYTGVYDPVTHEALCADTVCNAPQDGELGDFIGAQMTAANVGVPAVTVTKTGNGNVNSSDKFISCGSKCSASYNMNSSVTLVASPASGSVFTGWGGACSGTQLTCAVSVNDALNVTASFAPQFTLSIGRGGSGTVTGAGLDCGKVCSAKFTQGSIVTLTATPAAGLKFTGWGGACSGTSQTCAVAINKDTQVQANFK
jgi:hypothetical protein